VVERAGEPPDGAALVSRLTALVRQAMAAAPAWRFTSSTRASAMTDDERVELALGRLSSVSARAVQAVIDEAERPDSVWASRQLVAMGPFGADVADFVTRASFSRSQPDVVLPAEELEASLLDPVVFRDVLIAHHAADPLSSVREALGLTPGETLAVEAVAAYGFDDVELLLRAGAANYTLQWVLARDWLKNVSGYAQADAHGDAALEMHSMSAPFARFILARRPSIDELVRMMERDRFTRLGISPSRFPPEEYRAELSKAARPARGAGLRPTTRRQPSRFRRLPPRVAGWQRDSHVFLVPWRDTARIEAEAGATERIVGAPSHQHLVTRGRARRLRWQARILPALIPATLLALALGIDRSWGGDVMLDAQRFALDPVLATVTWATPLVAGLIVGLGLASLSDFRERAFDELAAERGSRQQYAEVRRERAFVSGLQRLRPEAFTAGGRRPLPSRFTIATETNGLVVLGRGTRPERVAAFHWLNIVSVTPAPPSDNDVTWLGDRRYRFDIAVRHGDTTVSLPCTIVRAKLDWGSEATAWHRPFPEFVSRLDTGIIGWMAGSPDPADIIARWPIAHEESSYPGTPFEAEVVDYEKAVEAPAESPSRVGYRRRLRTSIPLMLGITALGLLAPSLLATAIG
jgi:hypothetical protein